MREEFGLKLRNLRKERGLTMQNISDDIGISKATISKIEAGKINFGIDTVGVLCSYYGVKLSIE